MSWRERVSLWAIGLMVALAFVGTIAKAGAFVRWAVASMN